MDRLYPATVIFNSRTRVALLYYLCYRLVLTTFPPPKRKLHVVMLEPSYKLNTSFLLF